MENNVIRDVQLKNFTVFQDVDISFAKHINIISGENGVGKTHLMKLLYAIGTSSKKSSEYSQKHVEEELAQKLVGVFRPDHLGRLVKRKGGSNRANVNVKWSSNVDMNISFTISNSKSVDVEIENEHQWPTMVFIPVKEIISATENFSGLYEQYHIAFEETYYDLNKQLLLPLKKEPLKNTQKQLLETLEKVLSGKITQENNRFYLQQSGIGKLEMGLLAEGYRKIATIIQLIANGTIQENTILFWDEPESNINPKMIPTITKLFLLLAEMGVQLFISTHSYFILQELGLFNEYENKEKLDVRFISLHFNDHGKLSVETVSQLKELQHNAIEEEFKRLYNREQELFFND